ncbi:hypothetical protein AWB77_03664 [Caballeronia fortuita]|uniref:Uncharacterized protein n=1 Tax=Caballeronia fortuita TaxID=1777138 RepID=A0A158C5J3_9BURK|nr:hypothetical protein AWB77_03664 [Caballeronia fortuita]
MRNNHIVKTLNNGAASSREAAPCPQIIFSETC